LVQVGPVALPTPASEKKLITGLPTRPRLVVIRITPFAASVPYSVAAEAPFTTSTDSISSGVMFVSAPDHWPYW